MWMSAFSKAKTWGRFFEFILRHFSIWNKKQLFIDYGSFIIPFSIFDYKLHLGWNFKIPGMGCFVLLSQMTLY